jgi:hypothetical protein
MRSASLIRFKQLIFFNRLDYIISVLQSAPTLKLNCVHDVMEVMVRMRPRNERPRRVRPRHVRPRNERPRHVRPRL